MYIYILYIIQVYRSLRVCSEFKEIGKFIVCIYISCILYRYIVVSGYVTTIKEMGTFLLYIVYSGEFSPGKNFAKLKSNVLR